MGMLGRWIWRGMKVSVVAVCVTAWVGSYWYLVMAWHTPDGRNGVCASVEYGTVVVSSPIQRGSAFNVRLWQGRGRLVDAHAWPISWPTYSKWYWMCEWHGAGFAVGWGIPDKGWMVMVPLWFITGVAGLVLVWVWRRTRSVRVGRAVPVEVAKRNST